MPIYVAHAGKMGGMRLENLEAARDSQVVQELTNRALGMRAMNLYILDDCKRTYSLPAEMPHEGRSFEPYYVRVAHVDGKILPERAKIIVPGHSAMNPNPDYAEAEEIWIPREDEDGSHIVPVVSTGRRQGYEHVSSPTGDYQQRFPAKSYVLRGAIFHDQRILDGAEPLQRI